MCNDIYLTPHFSLKEFTESQTAKKHGITNIPSPEVVANLRRLCEGTLEPLREKLGLPIIITSGYRTKALNDILVHSSRRSQHMQGCAADFYVSPSDSSGSKVQDSGNQHLKLETGESPMKLETSSRRELLIKAFRLILQDPKIDFDQLILYPTFIHVSYVSRDKNRRKIIKAFGNGKYCALNRAQALSIV